MSSARQKFNSILKSKRAEAPKLFSVLIDQFFMSITTLLISIVLARTYNKIQYADLILLFSVTLFILGFQSSIISKPYAINLNDFEGNTQERYFHFNLHLKFVFTLFILIIFPLLYFLLFDSWDTNRLLFYSLYILAYTGYFFVRETLLSERNTRLNLFYGLACSFSLIALLAVIWFEKITDIYFFLGITSAIYIAATLVYLFFCTRRLLLAKKDYRDYFSMNWKIGKWMLGANFLFHISSNIYPWLLLYITTKSDIAIFGVLISVSGIINPIMTALSSYLLPLFVKMNLNRKALHSTVKKWTILFIGMALFLSGVGYFLGQKIVILLFGEKYAGLGILAVYPFLVQAINIAFAPLKISLNAIKRTDVNFWILIPRSILAVTLGYFLVSAYGLAGAFYTMIIENLIYQVLQWGIYRHLMQNKKAVLDS